MELEEQKAAAERKATKKQITPEDIAKMTSGLKQIKEDIQEKAKIKRRYLMCIYFYCQKCTRDWSVDMWVPKVQPCKCGNQSPRVTFIEKADMYQDL